MSFPRAPRTHSDSKTHRQILADRINNTIAGGLNVTGEVTLTANAATTTLTDTRLSAFSAVIFTPKTANAAAEQGNGTIYVSAYIKGSCTITHANNAQTDRTFRYVIIGGEGQGYS